MNNILFAFKCHLNFQALRKKQEVERKYLTDKLEAKKRERMLKRSQLDDRTDAELPTSTQAPKDKTVYKMSGRKHDYYINQA